MRCIQAFVLLSAPFSPAPAKQRERGGGGRESVSAAATRTLITFMEFAGLEERMALSMKREAAVT